MSGDIPTCVTTGFTLPSFIEDLEERAHRLRRMAKGCGNEANAARWLQEAKAFDRQVKDWHDKGIDPRRSKPVAVP